MIVQLCAKVPESEIDFIVFVLDGFRYKLVEIFDKKLIVINDSTTRDMSNIVKKIRSLKSVEQIIKCNTDYKLVGRCNQFNQDVFVGGLKLNGDDFNVIAGPCSVESEERIHKIASYICRSDAKILRGGTYKARTSPYSFHGLGKAGVQYLYQAAKKYNLLSITEVLDTRDVEFVSEYVDIIQIGTRNMYNFALLKEVAKTKKPVFLKRGFSASYKDFLLAAEYIHSEGNSNVILCERGIKTFEHYTRNTLDINAVPALKQLTNLPVFIDPSHGTGDRDFVFPISLAALAVGAHGIMLEVHDDPDASLSDAKQTIDIETFFTLMTKIRELKKVL